MRSTKKTLANVRTLWLENRVRKLENENGDLRGIIQQAADDVVAASYPRRMRLEWLEAARKALVEDDGPEYNH